LVLTVALLVLALGGLYVAMAERVEVVVLHSHGADGDHETRVWVVDDDAHAWLRTGASNASWLPRIRANSGVELERGGQTLAYQAVVIDTPETVARINRLSLEKYGWSEKLLRAMGTEPSGQVAIRLDPR
jgi:predicted membrane-bound spermidine synthase